jgi:hypothetical protein
MNLKDEDQYHDAISCLITTVQRGYLINKMIKFEVFIHKVDGFPDEKKMEIHNEISQRTSELLMQQDGNDTLIDKIYLKFDFFHYCLITVLPKLTLLCRQSTKCEMEIVQTRILI